MDDLLAVDQERAPLTIGHIRVLKLIRHGAGRPVKLPLRFKHERSIIDRLVADGLVIVADSGWPGVPGYILSPAGIEAITSWLSSQRYR